MCTCVCVCLCVCLKRSKSLIHWRNWAIFSISMWTLCRRKWGELLGSVCPPIQLPIIFFNGNLSRSHRCIYAKQGHLEEESLKRQTPCTFYLYSSTAIPPSSSGDLSEKSRAEKGERNPEIPPLYCGPTDQSSSGSEITPTTHGEGGWREVRV